MDKGLVQKAGHCELVNTMDAPLDCDVAIDCGCCRWHNLAQGPTQNCEPIGLLQRMHGGCAASVMGKPEEPGN